MTKVNKMTNVTNKQVKQVVQNAPYYLGESLIINNCTESIYNILRVKVIVANQPYCIDLIVDKDTNRFLALGETSDKAYNFAISCNICKTLSLIAYMKEAY